jgi:uncharacterized protein YllA (UPF0747 family)
VSAAEAPGVTPLYRRFLLREVSEGLPVRARYAGLPEIAERARATARRPVDAALLDAMRRQARRLSSHEATERSLEGLGAGRACVVFAGQQPGLGGGPLYTLHKVATAVAAARALRARRIEAIPAFWLAADDSDLDEARTLYLPGPDRSIRRAERFQGVPPGTMVGELPATESRAALAELLGELPPPLADLVSVADGRARDLGEWLSAVLLRLFGAEGLVVVDGRLPELWRAARPVIERYLERHREVSSVVDEIGKVMQNGGFGRPIHVASSESALFRRSGSRREKLDPEDLDRGAVEPAALSTGVVLRSFVQEAVFPGAAMIIGPGELAYLLQTDSVGALLGVERSPFVPRLAATWVDQTCAALVEGDPSGWLALLQAPARRVEARLRALLPRRLARALERLRAETGACLDETQSAAGEIDRSLAEFAAAGGRKIRHQVDRIEEQALSRMRAQAAKAGEILTSLPDFLTPRAGAQDRTYSLLWPFVRLSAEAVVSRTIAAAESHLERLEDGRPGHALISLEPEAAWHAETASEEPCRDPFASG